jgi:hypothetical protein
VVRIMNFLNYIKSLFPSFTKNAIMDSAVITAASIRDHTLPAYVTAVDLWKGQKFKSKEAQSLMGEIQKNLDKRLSKAPFEGIKEALTNGVIVIDYLGAYSKQIFSEHEANMGLTYAKATVVRSVQASEFANTYARRLLNYVYSVEAAELMKNQTETGGSSMSPAEVLWVKGNVGDFCIAINALSLDVKDFEKHLKGLPDAVISDLSEKTFVSTIGEAKIDPMQLRHLSVSVNPFYLFGMMVAEYQASKYKSAQEEMQLLQLRQLQLQKMFEKNPDAKLEKEIEYIQDRVTTINFRIQKMEKDYHV